MVENASALHMVLTGDPLLFGIVRLSLAVGGLPAVLFAALIGVPLGALIALTQFRGREPVIIVLNALMGLPPVVVGLSVFLMLSRSGPLGSLGLLFIGHLGNSYTGRSFPGESGSAVSIPNFVHRLAPYFLDFTHSRIAPADHG